MGPLGDTFRRRRNTGTIYLLIGIVSAVIARNMIVNRSRFLSQTLAELKRDVEGLRHAVAIKKDES